MNFKKQVMRYRLKADQKIGRANKTEVLNEDLLQIEKRLEHTRTACSSVYKRISQCLQSTGPDLEKRLKKLPETAVAHAMLDASNQLALESESSLQKSLKVCAEAETGIARERAVFEMFVEGHVVTPLHTLVENDIPNIQKMRERLKRLVLDRDNAHSAWQKAYKAQYNPGVNIQQMSIKADSMKDELDAAISRMEQCKDQLITELFEFLSKEGTYAHHITDFVSKELEYHKKCVAHLERLEPELKAAQENASLHSSYGSSLVDHLRVTEREVAIPIESCITCLLEIGIYEEGLFRLAGGAAKLKKFRALVGAGETDLLGYDAQDDVHAVAGTLKQYLRELPDPLLTQALYNEWIAVASISDNDAKLQEIWSLIDRLPSENKVNLGHLIRFCSVLASKQEYNKMSAGNIALVLAPNLLWAPSDDITANMMVSNSVAGIIESMITFDDYFFPDVPKLKPPPPPQSQGRNAGHDRTPSTGSLGESIGSSAAQNNSQVIPKSPSHSRTPSSDTTTLLNHQQSELTSTLPKSKKKKAPPAPSGPPPPTPQGQNRTSPVPATGESSFRPMASKRMSSKRPNIAPPAPPDIGNNTHPDVAPKPQPRPKPPIRKKPPTVGDGKLEHTPVPPPKNVSDEIGKPPSEAPPPIPEEVEDGVDETDPQTPPMPDLPPPPLPAELDESCGPDLSSELQSAPVVESRAPNEESDEERDFIVTSL